MLEDILQEYRESLRLIQDRIAQLREQKQTESIVNRIYQLRDVAEELEATIKEIEKYADHIGD